MIFIFINFFIFYSYFIFLDSHQLKPLSRKIVGSFLLLSAQIILTELILGLAHALYPQTLIIFNIIVSSVVFAIAKPHKISIHWAHVFNVFKELWSELAKWNNAILLVLFLFLLSWLMISIGLMPPRGIDDLTCHLPAIYENIKTQRIFLLPRQLNQTNRSTLFPLSLNPLRKWRGMRRFLQGSTLNFLLPAQHFR